MLAAERGAAGGCRGLPGTAASELRRRPPSAAAAGAASARRRQREAGPRRPEPPPAPSGGAGSSGGRPSLERCRGVGEVPERGLSRRRSWWRAWGAKPAGSRYLAVTRAKRRPGGGLAARHNYPKGGSVAGSGVFSQALRREEAVSSCARGGFGGMLGKSSSLRGSWGAGTGCPGKRLSRRPWKSPKDGQL